MIPIVYLYCWWILFWALLFLFDIITISPLISSAIATGFSFYIHFISKYRKKFSFNLKSFILFIEISLLLILLYKTNLSNYKSDIFYNALIFTIYLMILYINNKSFYKIYFVDLIKSNNNNLSVFNYIKKRLLSLQIL